MKVRIISLLFFWCCNYCLTAQIVEQASDDFGSYCQPDNSSGEVQLNTAEVRRGTTAFQHRVDNAFPRRAELDDCSFHNYNPDRTYWYGFSLYLPQASFAGDFLQFVAQWRFSNLAWGGYSIPNCEMFETCAGGDIYGGSGHHLLVYNQRWVYSLVHQDPDCADCRALDHLDLDLGAIQTDVWTDFVIESNFSADQDGYINIWRQVQSEGYELVAAYRGRTWLNFYQANSDQRDNGAYNGRVMSPNHTVGLYYGSDNQARTMYSDEIAVYQEEQFTDGFSEVAIDGVERPDSKEIGPQNWLYDYLGDFEEELTMSVELSVQSALENGGLIGISHHEKINSVEDLAILIQFDENGQIQAWDGNQINPSQTTDYQIEEQLTLTIQANIETQTYTALLERVDGTIDTLANDYRFRTDWNGGNKLSYFTYHTYSSGIFQIQDLSSVLECPATPLSVRILPTHGERYVIGFDLRLEGSNLDTAIVLLSDESNSTSDEAPIAFKVLNGGIIQARTGNQFTLLDDSPLPLQQTIPMKLVVDATTQTYSWSYFLPEIGEQRLLQDVPFSGANLQYLSSQTVSGGCLDLNNIQIADLSEPIATCETADWQSISFPVEPARFNVSHDFILQQPLTAPLTIGFSTGRTVQQINDLGFYLQCLPGNRIGYVQANEVRTDVSYQLVVGERYRCDWEVDVQNGNYALTITNSIGQTVQFAQFSQFNADWNNPSNSFQQLAYNSDDQNGCAIIENIKTNPCGPIAWQTQAIPVRASGELLLSFRLTPSGDDFVQGEMVLSTTPIPTETSIISKVVLDSSGVFLAENGAQFNAETTYRHTPDSRVNCRWIVDLDEGTYDFQVDRFANFKDIAVDYPINADWTGEAVAYLCYRTYEAGCMEIAALAEGEACGPEDWSTQALNKPIDDAFSFEIEITPTGNNFRDGVWGLSHKEQPTDFNDLGPILQFNADGNIKVRNGDKYEAVFDLPYRYGTTYRIKFNIDVRSKTYSVFLVENGDLITLANNYQFRSDWTGSSVLNYVAYRTVDAGCLETDLFGLVTSLDTQLQTAFRVRHLGDRQFVIQSENPIQHHKVLIFNTIGQVVCQQEVTTSSFELAQTLRSGMYILWLQDTQTQELHTLPFFID